MALIITTVGLTKLASATPENQLEIESIAVDDGNGITPVYSESTTALVNQVWIGDASAPIRRENDAQLVFEGYLTQADGPFTIRGIGLIDVEGDLIAVGASDQEIPVIGGNTGFLQNVTLRAVLQLSNASEIDLISSISPDISHSAIADRDATDSHPATAISYSGGGNVDDAIPDKATAQQITEQSSENVFADPSQIAAMINDLTPDPDFTPLSQGLSFEYDDTTSAVGTVTDISQADDAVVTLAGHGFSNGDRFVIYNVSGMTEINGATFEVSVIDTDTFNIGIDTTTYTAYTSGGDLYDGHYTLTTQAGVTPITAYETGKIYRANISTTNPTTTPTLNIDGVGAANILDSRGNDLQISEIKEKHNSFVYESPNFLYLDDGKYAGIDRHYVDELPNRSSGVDYYNSLPYEIEVIFRVSLSSTTSWSVIVNGNTIMDDSIYVSGNITKTFKVPAYSSYRVTASRNITLWWEYK